MSEHKILYQDSQIKLNVEENGYVLSHNNPHILILPYTMSENKYPEKLGIIGNDLEVLAVEILDSDIDIFTTAKRGLLERTGFRIDETDKWDFLGPIRASYLLGHNNPAFSVDITGIVVTEEIETAKDFNLIPVSDALDSNSALLHSLFIKTFQSKLINK